MTRNTLLTWLLIFALALIDAVWLPIEGMSVAPQALALICAPSLGMMILAWIYTSPRPDFRIASLTLMASVMFAFMGFGCIFSYLMVTLHQPLVDPCLVAADRAFGLNWLAMYEWIGARPVLHIAMKLVYMSLIPQFVLLQIVLHFRKQIARAWEAVWAFLFACLGCIFFSGIWPAAGAFVYFHVNLNEPYVHEFASLRDGSLKIIGAAAPLQGLVEFPSLHMALALLFPYAVRGVPVLFPLLVVLDALVIATTPAIGGHHFADLWGGAVLALLSIGLVRQDFMTKLVAETAPSKPKKPAGRKSNAGRTRGSSRA